MIKLLTCSSVLLVLFTGYGTVHGGGHGSKHDILKIHVPEIVKHQYHTHYVFIHKHPPPKKHKEHKKKEHHHHHHKHVHVPHGHHYHKHWYVHKSSHGQKHGHKGHGHPVVKTTTTVKHHKPHHHKTHHVVHKTPPKMHHTKHHTKKKEHKGKHHEAFTNYDSPGYEVVENHEHDPDYQDESYDYDDGGYSTKPFFGYPSTQSSGQYGQYPVTSYDISPYHQVDTSKPAADEEHSFGGEEIEFDPHYENDFSFQHQGYGDSARAAHLSDNFGENVPGYTQHHKHFLNEINHDVHSTVSDDSVTKFASSGNQFENSDAFGHSFGNHYGSP